MNDQLKMSGYEAEMYFQEQRSRLIRHTKGHQWTKTKKNQWLVYCDECGLVWSNNKLTQKEVKRGCVFYRLAPA